MDFSVKKPCWAFAALAVALGFGCNPGKLLNPERMLLRSDELVGRTITQPGTLLPTQLRLIGSSVQGLDVCASLRVETVDGSVSRAVVADLPVALTGEGSGTLHADPACTGAAIHSVIVAANASSQGFFYKNPTETQVTLSAQDSSGGLAQGNLEIAIRTGSGGLDPTFASGGIKLLQVGSTFKSTAMAAGPANTYLTAGYSTPQALVVHMLNSDGSLAMSFANQGVFSENFGGGGGAAYAIKAEGSSIFVGGAAGTTALVLKLLVDGRLDTSFGNGGKLIQDLGNLFSRVNSIAVQPDGKILAAGESHDTSGTVGAFVMRINPDGNPDSTFSDGVVYLSFEGLSSIASEVILDSNNQVVVAGKAIDASGDSIMAIARLNSNGTLDSAFGNGGKVLVTVSRNDEALHVVQQLDGKYLATGSSGRSPPKFCAVRLLPNGQLDPGFATGGKLEFVPDAVGGAIGFAEGGAGLHPDGKIFVAGFYDKKGVISRLLANGTIDTSWGSGGHFFFEYIVPAETTRVASMLMESGFGRLLVTGASSPDSSGVARILQQ